MSGLIYYTNPQSRGRIPHWMLEEVGQPYETVWLDYGHDMKRPEYLALNPMGKVPTLVDGTAVVTEAAAICAYLADRFPDAGLAPPLADPRRAAYFRWMFFAAGPVEAAVTARAMRWEVPPEKSGTLGFGSHERTVSTLATALGDGPYLCGEQFTAADVYVGAQIAYGLAFGTLEARPEFTEYTTRLHARPAYARAEALNKARLEAQRG